MKQHVVYVWIVVLVCGMSAALAAAPSGQPPTVEEPKPLTFMANLYQPGNDSGTAIQQVVIRINRITPPPEALAIAKTTTALGLRGQLQTVRQVVIGFLRIGDEPDYPIHLATMRALDHGRRFVVVATVPVSNLDQAMKRQEEKFPYGVIDFEINEKGKGEGTFISAATIRITSAGDLEVEEADAEEARLLNIRLRR